MIFHSILFGLVQLVDLASATEGCQVGPTVRANLPADLSLINLQQVTEHLKKTKLFKVYYQTEKPYYSLIYNADLSLIPFDYLEALSVGLFVWRGNINIDKKTPDIPGFSIKYPEYKKVMDRKNDRLEITQWAFVRLAKT